MILSDTLDFCVLNPLIVGGLDIGLQLGGNPWNCDCKLAYIKSFLNGPMKVSVRIYFHCHRVHRFGRVIVCQSIMSTTDNTEASLLKFVQLTIELGFEM